MMYPRQTRRLRGRVGASLLAVIMLCSLATAAVASGRYGKYLSPDQAFQLQATATPDAVILDWHIADGYYLYRDKISIHASSTPLGKACLPPGETKTDPYFGQTEVYHHEVRVVAPYAESAPGEPLQLTVTYQGCAESGLCYPPIVKHLTVDKSGQEEMARVSMCPPIDGS